jgi:hypothetical protein
MRHFIQRICPGRHIADSTFKIAAASILCTFDLLKERDERGNIVEPKIAYETGVAR